MTFIQTTVRALYIVLGAARARYSMQRVHSVQWSEKLVDSIM